MDKIIKIPELELMILQVLWSNNNKASVQKIIDSWNEKPEPGYTTILKKLQVMEEKNLVRHEKAGRAFNYLPLVSKEEVSKNKIGNMLTTMFQGNKLDMVGAFFADAELTTEELDKIKEMISKQESEDV